MEALNPSVDWIRNLYVMHLGGEDDDGLREDALARSVLRVTWNVPPELIQRKDWLGIERHLKAGTAKNNATEASADTSRLRQVVESTPNDVWVAFIDRQLYWTRLADGPLELGDGPGAYFRRTSGWRSAGRQGEPLRIDDLGGPILKLFQRVRPTVHLSVAAEREAFLGAIFGSEWSKLSRGPEVLPSDRAHLVKHWSKLKSRWGWVDDLAHGLQAGKPGDKGWVASMYWANSTMENDVSFCIAFQRIVPEGERESARLWLDWQRNVLGGRDAEYRGTVEGLDSAYRVGFTTQNAITFLERWTDAFDPMKADHYGRWKIPTEPLATLDPAPSPAETSPPAKASQPPRPANDLWQFSIDSMVKNAHSAAAESGTITERVAKHKEVRMSADELRQHIRELIAAKQGRCAITGIEFHFPEPDSSGTFEHEFCPSLDRIDSDGHYARGNLQVVCRFINRWKSDNDDTHFRRLVERLRAN
ncbi:hypothetical protein [Roseateles noduli]|uniref:hypothetical protein n=1 Tax=Roseateles noduli TaxID=2052484 RepID=UPI003D64696E